MSKSFHILICSDSEPSIKKIREYLQKKEYKVSLLSNEESVFSFLKNNSVQLIIFELDYKKKDGISMTSEIRNSKDVEQPYIIILSDKQDDYIQITAFNSGADDFILTPIKPVLLEAKISTFKRRLSYKIEHTESRKIQHSFFVDKEQYLIITKDGKISLPRKEFEMINLMYQNNHKTFTRQDFATLVWNDIKVANSRTIDIHIYNIRKILGSNVVKTNKGVGYSINKSLFN